MLLNAKRKVAELNLSTSEFLLPLFEAVVNAVEAVEEAIIPSGKITITIVRDESQSILPHGEGKLAYQPIASFLIEDNGIGFNKSNFESFDNAYTDHKTTKGGKGVGRFTMLKAFDQVKIKSRYGENGGLYERGFTFDLKQEVFEVEKPVLVEEGFSGSVVELSEYIAEYRKQSAVSLDYIAEKIVEHCLVLFLSKRMPEVLLIDD